MSTSQGPSSRRSISREPSSVTAATFQGFRFHTRVDFSDVEFHNTDLGNTSFCAAAKLSGVVFENVELPRAMFAAYVDLSGVEFRDTDLRNAVSNNSLDLSKSEFRSSNLSGLNLRDFDIRNSEFHGVDLSKTDLRRSDLEGRTLIDTDLRGSVLREASLHETHLRHIRVSDETDFGERCVYERIADEQAESPDVHDRTNNSVPVRKSVNDGSRGLKARLALRRIRYRARTDFSDTKESIHIYATCQ